jgi:hypothetical protein
MCYYLNFRRAQKRLRTVASSQQAMLQDYAEDVNDRGCLHRAAQLEVVPFETASGRSSHALGGIRLILRRAPAYQRHVAGFMA